MQGRAPLPWIKESGSHRLRSRHAGLIGLFALALLRFVTLGGGHGDLDRDRYCEQAAKQLGQHWAADGIRVNCVSGPTYFEGGNWSLVETHMKPLFDSIQAQQPFGRFGNPEEIARAIVFLASPASSYTSGTNLVVDGGFTKRVQF